MECHISQRDSATNAISRKPSGERLFSFLTLTYGTIILQVLCFMSQRWWGIQANNTWRMGPFALYPEPMLQIMLESRSSVGRVSLMFSFWIRRQVRSMASVQGRACHSDIIITNATVRLRVITPVPPPTLPIPTSIPVECRCTRGASQLSQVLAVRARLIFH